MATIVFTSIFRLTGAYVGVLTDEGWFFDATGRYIGWYDDQKQVWNADGSYLGEIVKEHYILKRNDWRQNLRETPKVPPVRPELPAASPARLAMNAEPGWKDALTNVLYYPDAEELEGRWVFHAGWIELGSNQQYSLSINGRLSESGDWSLSNGLMLSPAEDAENRPSQVVYQIIEFIPGRMILRQQIPEGRSLPITLTKH
jgi:hypothetical protein